MRDWLVEKRKESGLSQKAVCDAVNISQPTYWEYEHDICTPTVPVAKRIGSVLGFAWDKFYDDSIPEKQEKAV